MKFTMFDKESKDRKYRENPYRSENFQIDPYGVMRCPDGKAFHFRYRKNVDGNKYGRQEEVFECENCTDCPCASERKKDAEKPNSANQPGADCHAPGGAG